ncbi:MAG: 2-C-methyl-D-erythritol 4-phosphate cytidylyltransferase, partial [Deltaproteobacteria bacterium]|nr:2-C-methyl-D-erythritol 4-phosphate cytidylyltransferase [Deltaproteobacteria bacterium]
RRDSVWNGLQVLPSKGPVLIHDGVRPFVSESLISRVIKGLEDADACIPGIAVTDTIKEIDGEFIKKTIPRDMVYRIQTPQAFRYESIMNAHTSSKTTDPGNITDDSTLVECTGGKVRLVQGDPYNIKITLKEDHYIAEAILKCHTESA